MRFGRIEYLNLLPFHVFMKRYLRYSQAKSAIRYGADVPSKINRAFERRRIDAAFISSVKARGCTDTGLGIIARGEVQSVLLVPGEPKPDSASATSNVLARVLGLEGEVLIGDRALRAYAEGVEAIDLAQAWERQTGLPFVFAVLCTHGHVKEAERLSRRFARAPQKIPQYLLRQASRRSGIAVSVIREYLGRIDYVLDHRSRRGLKRFWRLAAEKGVRRGRQRKEPDRT